MAQLCVLSPSQQEGNQYAGGGIGYTDTEEYWMRLLAEKILQLWKLQANGIKMVVVNEGSWYANVAKSNSLGATEHVALHTNAGGGRGCEIYHYPNSTKGKALASALYTPIAIATVSADRGIKTTTTLGEVTKTKAPCALIEYIFHDNLVEAEEMRKGIDKFAVATVKGLCKYYGKEYQVPDTTTPPVPTTKLPVYRFYNKKNGSHFYTASETEKASVSKIPEYQYEGIAFYAVGS